MKAFVLPVILLLCGCDTLPRDPDGTTARIERTGNFSIAVMEPSLRSAPATERLVHELERRTNGHARWRSGSGEALLQQLDDGALDIVIGRFQADSPWKNEVTFGPPLATSGKKHAQIELKAAMRNGENRWIIEVERASRAVSAEARQP